MKLKSILISGPISAALLLASCGEGNSTAEEANPAETVASNSDYPLDVCVVSGEKLGSMGKPVVINHEGTEVRFCCDSCLPDFKAAPEKFVAMVKAGKVETPDHSNH